MLEFQTSALSGPGNDTLALNPDTTLFNLYDNTLGKYLEGGQHDTNTLDGWIALDSSLSSDDLQGISIGLGLAGGGSPPESLTVDSAVVTPEPDGLAAAGMALCAWLERCAGTGANGLT